MTNEYQDDKELVPLNPWDRYVLPDGTEEPDLWQGRFFRYMMSGTGRKIAQVCREEHERQGKEYKKTGSAWRRNATKWHWEERARLWDDEQRRKVLDMRDKEIDEAVKRHVRQSLALQNLGEAKINDVLADPEGLEEVTVGDARLLIKDGQDLERRGLGLPSHLWAIAEMTDEELYEGYAELLAREESLRIGDGEEGTVEAGDWRVLPPEDKG